MRKKIVLSITLVMLLSAISGAASAAKAIDGAAILRSLDSQSAITNNDLSMVVTMITEDPEKGVQKQKVSMFRRDKEDKFLLLFQEPAVQKGQGYLCIDDSLWFYDPESRKFTHTSLKENFGSTDAKNSDFSVSTLSQDYAVTSASEGKLGAYNVYILELKAKNDEVTYPYLKLWVNQSPQILLLKSEEYSLSKRLLRTTLYAHYTKVGNSYIADTIIFTDELVKGQKTQIYMENISISKLPDSVFTKSYLERVNN